jgi:hypothetical protein
VFFSSFFFIFNCPHFFQMCVFSSFGFKIFN